MNPFAPRRHIEWDDAVTTEPWNPGAAEEWDNEDHDITEEGHDHDHDHEHDDEDHDHDGVPAHAGAGAR
jgi:hypothetical protein